MTTDTRTGAGPRKPRLILMGEFSSGKSTLSNILLGAPTLPMQVTATRLPPVHVTYGERAAYAMTHDGTPVEVDLDNLTSLSPETYRSLHVSMQADTLELCDIVDMPGISDPNMPAEIWDNLTSEGDHVIWCTHATQAWRLSEAAVWDRMRGTTSGLNILLITQFDKLRNPRDKARVLSRVMGETSGKFASVFPVSLLEAAAAGEDYDAWVASGVHAFMDRLVEILLSPHSAQAAPAAITPAAFASPAEPASVVMANFDPADRRQHDRLELRPEARVIPRRVQARSDAADRPRPTRPAGNEIPTWLSDPGGLPA